MNNSIPFRIGHGYDLHRLEPFDEKSATTRTGCHARNPLEDAAGDRRQESPAPEQTKPLILCGVPLEHDCGPVGHSDGDAGLHAVTDAILGALGEPDLGELFPNTSPKWRDANSEIFVREAVARMRGNGYEVGNIDITIILERPKLQSSKDAMRRKVSELLQIPTTRVNVKGKTHEQVDALGEGRAVEVQVVVLLQQEKN